MNWCVFDDQIFIFGPVFSQIFSGDQSSDLQASKCHVATDFDQRVSLVGHIGAVRADVNSGVSLPNFFLFVTFLRPRGRSNALNMLYE